MTGRSRSGVLLPVCAGLIALLPAASQGQAPSRAACRDAADCNFAGTRELKAGRMRAAQAAFEKEACFAWGEDKAAGIVRAHNNLALLALRRGEPLQARMWARVALYADPASRAARHNARLADEAVARLPPGQGVTGTSRRWGDSLDDVVIVQELPPNHLRYEFWAVSPSRVPCHALEHTWPSANGEVCLYSTGSKTFGCG